MSNEVVKNTKSNILNVKVNNLDKKLSNASTLIHINQCNTGKQNLAKKKKKLEMLIKKYLALGVESIMMLRS